MNYPELAGNVNEATPNDQELFVEERQQRKVEWDGATVKSVETERDSGASLRVYDDGRIGFSYANKNELDPEWLVKQAERTRAMLPSDEHHALSDADPCSERSTVWFDPVIRESSSDRMDGITERIREWLEREESVTNLQVTFSENDVTRQLYRNAESLSDEQFSRFSFSVWAICDDGDDVQSGFERQASYGFSNLDVPAVIDRAINRGLEKLGATPPESRTGPAVLNTSAASGLLKLVKQMTDGEAVVKGRSAWDDETLGTRVGVEELQLVDDPSLQTGANCRQFDAEGHEMDAVTVIEDGVYRSFLTNQYVANRTGHENNHRASRTYSSRPGVGTTNFYLKPGGRSFDEMKEELGDGPVITGIQPASGLDSVAGHFSVGCSGYFVRNGQYHEPFNEATITGEIEDFLGNIEAIGDTCPEGYAVASPALLVSELSLGGN